MQIQSSEIQLFKKAFEAMFPNDSASSAARLPSSRISTAFHATSDGTLLIAENSQRSLSRVISSQPCDESLACSHHWLDELPHDGNGIEVARRGELIDFKTQVGGQTRVLSLVSQSPSTRWAGPVMGSAGVGFVDALASASEICRSGTTSCLWDSFQLDSNRGAVTAQNECEMISFGRYKFPWRHPVEIKTSNVFASLDVKTSDPVLCGVLERELFIFAGPWRLRLPLAFEPPAIDIDQEKRGLGRASNRILFDTDDLAFLVKHCEQNSELLRSRHQVSLVLGDRVEVVDSDESAPKRLILSRSTQKGRPEIIPVESRHLLRIAKLGLSQLCWHANDGRLSSRDERRIYIFDSPPAARTFDSRTDDIVEIDSVTGSPVLA